MKTSVSVGAVFLIVEDPNIHCLFSHQDNLVIMDNLVIAANLFSIRSPALTIYESNFIAEFQRFFNMFAMWSYI